MTIQLDRVQLAAMEAIGLLTPASTVALWAPTSYPRAALGSEVVTAEIVRGPRRTGRGVRGYEAAPTVLRLTLGGVTAGDRVGLALTGARFLVDVPGGGTDETVRDALLAVFTDDPLLLPGVTPVAVGTDAIDFDADGVPGLLWGARAIGPSGVVTLDATTTADVESVSAAQTCVLELQAYSTDEHVGAQELLGGLADLNRSDVVDARSKWGVSFQGPLGDVVNLRTQDGAEWRSRATARLSASLRSYSAIAIDTIDTVNVTGVGDVADLAAEVTAP